MTPQKPKTYEAEINNRKVQVTVPENPNPEEIFTDAIQDNLSPKAVAAIAHCLRTARIDDEEVNSEVWWFIKLLENMLGKNEMNRLIDELGL